MKMKNWSNVFLFASMLFLATNSVTIAQTNGLAKFMEKSRISPIAVQYGFKSLEALNDSCYNVETTIAGLESLNIKKLENSGY